MPARTILPPQRAHSTESSCALKSAVWPGRRLVDARPIERGRLGRACRVGLRHAGPHLGREDADLLLLVDGEELLAHPAEDVVDDRLGDPDVGVVRQPRRLEAHVGELRHVDLERHAVLETERHGDHERVHQAGERRSFLRDVEEDVAGGAVLEHPDVDVPLVLADAELATDLGAVVRQPSAPGRGRRSGRADGARQQPLALLGLARERLGDLAVVAVDRDRLDAELPGVAVDVGDVVDGRALRQVDRLRDRAGDERLDRAHHLHVAAVVHGPVADRAVEDRVVLGLHVRGPDDGVALVDEGDDLATSFGE